jgi:ABC-type multidrug transport system ATPase subunit
LRKVFGDIALADLTLEVALGEIFGLLGPNGAGKSTTVGVLTTRVQATSGEGWIGLHNVARDRVAVKRAIGVVPQRPNLDFRTDRPGDSHLPRRCLACRLPSATRLRTACSSASS